MKQVSLGSTRTATAVALAFSAMLALPAHASHFHRGPTSSHKASHSAGSTSGRHGKHAEHAAAAGRPRAIDDARATQIQTALVKAGYLQSASGRWDGDSADAMRKLQSDNGWQTKNIPDSRALIKLGLGPGSEAAPAAATGGSLASSLTGTPAAPQN